MGENILIAAKNQESANLLKDLLTSEGYIKFTLAFSAEDAKIEISKTAFDCIVINTPLSDEGGLELSVYSSENTRAYIILLVKNELYEQICKRVDGYGIFVLSKPLNKNLFHQVLKLTEASRQRELALEKENFKLKSKVEEIKIINRAKLVLMQYLSMSEATAHRYIEKQAMDMRVSKKQIAEQVLNMYEN